eukprot:192698-Heterocapsa_arctica.AAC.1
MSPLSVPARAGCNSKNGTIDGNKRPPESDRKHQGSICLLHVANQRTTNNEQFTARPLVRLGRERGCAQPERCRATRKPTR